MRGNSNSQSSVLQLGIFALAILALVLTITITEVRCKPTEIEANSSKSSNSNETESEDEIEAKDLKYTFANEDEIPEGFKVQEQRALKFTEFSACKDDSGGICIPVGQCTKNLKPAGKNEKACNAGEECCLGGPPEGTPCKNKGGECVEAAKCGRNPAQITSDTECNHANGETCCIWLY